VPGWSAEGGHGGREVWGAGAAEAIGVRDGSLRKWARKGVGGGLLGLCVSEGKGWKDCTWIG
jgi:hypothetical protein